MTHRLNGYCRGRADPFGLLVLAVMFALFVTIGIQAHATIFKQDTFFAGNVCDAPCVQLVEYQTSEADVDRR